MFVGVQVVQIFVMVRIVVLTPWYSVSGPRDAVPSNFSSFFFIMNGHHIYVFNFAI